MIDTEKVTQMAKVIFDEQIERTSIRADRMFSGLLLFQWALGMVFAFWISPKMWSIEYQSPYIHLLAALCLGCLLSVFPSILVFLRPGAYSNRFVITFAQMGFSILFIHLTGGRIETHFHIFGSLAFIAAYRDTKPLIMATIITALDHFVRGAFWPESVYGILSASPLRALEHTGWVLFEDMILYALIISARKEMNLVSHHQAMVELTLENVELLVQKRTDALRESHKKIRHQEQMLIASSKLSELGEMAGGLAHEINNPLGIIQGKASILLKKLQNGKFDLENGILEMNKILSMTERAAKIVHGLKSFSRNAHNDPFVPTPIKSIFENVLSLCSERFKKYDIRLEVDTVSNLTLECRSTQLEQVILNLLNNAHDAVAELPERWVRLSVKSIGDMIQISVTDSGKGIPEDVVEKMLQPFFTTKELGKGTGLGLSISNGIIGDHQGKLSYDENCGNTCFLIELPKVQIKRAS